jgi:hypothetical protein
MSERELLADQRQHRRICEMEQAGKRRESRTGEQRPQQ